MPRGDSAPLLVRPARSRILSNDKGRTSDNSACGSEVKRCAECSKSARLTKETIRNGLRLLRVRYGLPYSELPDLDPSQLGRFHLFLLGQGKERPSVPFPRRQRPGENGLCTLQRLRRHERWEFALGVASLKRNLPPGCSHHTPSGRSLWEKNAFSQPPPTSSEYLQFVRRCCAQIFTPGWDRGYAASVGSHLPNPSARKPRFSRADLLWAGRRDEFFTSTTSETDLRPLMEARYKEVTSAGKKRPLVIFDESTELLGPLHKVMYSHLRRQEWLLCGPPTEERMTSVCVNAIQTSVDLVAATDGLSHSVAEAILDCAFFSCEKIPRSLRLLAKASLSPIIRDQAGVHRRVRHGQMMGSYLSFPLLCVQSYCAARWAARFDPHARFLVNGDDTVISAEREVTEQEYPSGFRLNSDKTIRAENIVELNSTVFLRRGGRWREVRHLRRGGAPSDFPGMMHMASAVMLSRGWEDAFTRSRIGRRWGFLPSQLGHTSYASWLRERQLARTRTFTHLPGDSVAQNEEGLRRIIGRDPTPVEAEALRSSLWSTGRRGGLKRDVYSPTPGHVRRTYGYRSQTCRSFLSFVGWGDRRHASGSKKRVTFFLLPEEFVTDEEQEGLDMLALWRNAFVSQAIGAKS